MERANGSHLQEPYARFDSGYVSVYVNEPEASQGQPKPLRTEKDANAPRIAASINKLHIARIVLEDFDPNNQLILERAADVPQSRGTGLLHYAPEGYSLTTGEAVNLMLTESDNTAMKLLVRSVGGAERANQLFSDKGLVSTQLEPLPGNNKFYTGTTSAEDVAQTLAALVGLQVHIKGMTRSIGGSGMRGYDNSNRRQPSSKLRIAGLRALDGRLSEHTTKRLIQNSHPPETPEWVKKGNLAEDGLSHLHEAGFDSKGRLVVLLTAMASDQKINKKTGKTVDIEPPNHKQYLHELYLSITRKGL